MYAKITSINSINGNSPFTIEISIFDDTDKQILRYEEETADIQNATLSSLVTKIAGEYKREHMKKSETIVSENKTII